MPGQIRQPREPRYLMAQADLLNFQPFSDPEQILTSGDQLQTPLGRRLLLLQTNPTR